MRGFGIIPAAGWSQRMGCPKLLLPWRGSTVMETVLRAWRSSGVERTVIVVRAADEELARCCAAVEPERGMPATPGVDTMPRWGPLTMVRPAVDPPDMKSSIGEALRWLAWEVAPSDDDVWLLAPADLPELSAASIDRLLEFARENPGSICVPLQGGRRGHPVAFPWRLAAEVGRLGPDEGVNRLLSLHPVREMRDPSTPRLEDLDTPEDYARLVERREPRC